MIPYVMDDTKTLAEIVADNSNGVGRLAECAEAPVTEGLDGQYTSTMVIPKAAYNSGLVHKNGIIKLKPNGKDVPQLFRVVRFKETLSSGLIECDLEHISYDLNKAIMSYPVEVGGDRLEYIIDIFNGEHYVHVYPAGVFTATTNIPLTRYPHWRWNRVTKTVREALLAEDGICAVEGFQIHWDNLTYEFVERRGSDKTDSVVIEYGKNIMDFSNEEDISSVYDGIIGNVYVPSKWYQPITTDPIPIVAGTTPQHLLMVDLSKMADGFTNPPSYATVTNWARNWIAANNITTPKVAIDIDLVSLENDGEYDKLKSLEGLELGDTITVKIGDTSVVATVTEVTYDSLTERYTEIKLGNYRPSLADTILGLVGDNSTALSNTQQEYNSTFQSMKTQLLFDSYNSNESSDWNSTRYNQYKISGNGFIVLSINAYTNSNLSYGTLKAYIQHSTNNGSSWYWDGYVASRHDSTSAVSEDGISLTIPMAVTDGELIRAVWQITKEDRKICRVKMLGIGVTAEQTVNGGTL